MFSLRLKDFCLAWEASCVHWPLRWAPPDPLQQQTGPDNLTPFNKASFSFSFSISRGSRGFRRPVLIEFSPGFFFWEAEGLFNFSRKKLECRRLSYVCVSIWNTRVREWKDADRFCRDDKFKYNVNVMVLNSVCSSLELYILLLDQISGRKEPT